MLTRGFFVYRSVIRAEKSPVVLTGKGLPFFRGKHQNIVPGEMAEAAWCGPSPYGADTVTQNIDDEVRSDPATLVTIMLASRWATSTWQTTNGRPCG